MFHAELDMFFIHKNIKFVKTR